MTLPSRTDDYARQAPDDTLVWFLLNDVVKAAVYRLLRARGEVQA